MITCKEEVVAIACTVEMSHEVLEERFSAERCRVVAVPVKLCFADEALNNLVVAGW